MIIKREVPKSDATAFLRPQPINFTKSVNMTLDFSNYGLSGMPEDLYFGSILKNGMTSDLASSTTALQSTAGEDIPKRTYFSLIPSSSVTQDSPVSGLDSCQTDGDKWCTALDEGIDLSPIAPADQNSFESLLPSCSVTPFPWADECTDVSVFMIPDFCSEVSPQIPSNLSECRTLTSPPDHPHISSFAAAPNNNFDTDSQRWHATQSRSRAADRSFIYGVLTTKIFCRPSCASRRASRRHVRFFLFPGAIEAAEGAGFRPCKRCIPDALGVKNTAVLGVCEVLRLIITKTFGKSTADGKADMKLESLAKSAGLSTFHFHRMFKATTQITPGDFTQACRSLALQDALGKDQAQGFSMDTNAVALVENSPCWSVRSARKALGGITPTEYTKGAPTVMFQYCCVGTPPGTMCVIFSPGRGDGGIKLHAVLLGEDAEARACERFPAATASSQHANRVAEHVRELEEEGRDRDTELTAEIMPVLWRARVWLRLVHHYGD